MIRREGWFMPMPENLSEAAQRERTRRMLNQKDFELNMGPDGAQLMGGRLDTNGKVVAMVGALVTGPVPCQTTGSSKVAE